MLSYSDQLDLESLRLFGKFNSSLFNAYNDSLVSIDKISNDLIVKASLENEGTTKFSQFHLKKGVKSSMTINGKSYAQGTLGISLFDTRGQIKMSKKEETEINYLIEVT